MVSYPPCSFLQAAGQYILRGGNLEAEMAKRNAKALRAWEALREDIALGNKKPPPDPWPAGTRAELELALSAKRDRARLFFGSYFDAERGCMQRFADQNLISQGKN